MKIQLFIFLFYINISLTRFGRFRAIINPISKVARGAGRNIKKIVRPMRRHFKFSNLANLVGIVSDGLNIGIAANEISNMNQEQEAKKTENKKKGKKGKKGKENKKNTTSDALLPDANLRFKRHHYLLEEDENIFVKNQENINNSFVSDLNENNEEVDDDIDDNDEDIILFDPENIKPHKEIMVDELQKIKYAELLKTIQLHIKDFFKLPSKAEIINEGLKIENETENFMDQFNQVISLLYISTIVSLDKFLYVMIENIQRKAIETEELINEAVSDKFEDCIDYIETIIKSSNTNSKIESSELQEKLTIIGETMVDDLECKMFNEVATSDEIKVPQTGNVINRIFPNLENSVKGLVESVINQTINDVRQNIYFIDNNEEIFNLKVVKKLFENCGEKHSGILYDLAELTTSLVFTVVDGIRDFSY